MALLLEGGCVLAVGKIGNTEGVRPSTGTTVTELVGLDVVMGLECAGNTVSKCVSIKVKTLNGRGTTADQTIARLPAVILLIALAAAMRDRCAMR